MSLNIGVFGAGFIGDIHLDCWKDIDEVEVKGVVDKKPSNRKKASDSYGVPGYESSKELLEREDLDLVDICLPTHLHKEATELASDYVEGIICEKPIARDLDEALAMKEITRQKDVNLYIGHVVRFFPEYVKMRNRILEGEIGHVG